MGRYTPFPEKLCEVGTFNDLYQFFLSKTHLTIFLDSFLCTCILSFKKYLLSIFYEPDVGDMMVNKKQNKKLWPILYGV